MNPGSQLNFTLLGNTVESPDDEPFIGADKGPQSTAVKQTIKSLQDENPLSVSTSVENN